MKSLAAVGVMALGIVMCLIADYQTQHNWEGGEIDPSSWNLFGSIWLGGGAAAFVISFFFSSSKD